MGWFPCMQGPERQGGEWREHRLRQMRAQFLALTVQALPRPLMSSVTHINSQGLSFLTCKMGMLEPTGMLQGSNERRALGQPRSGPPCWKKAAFLGQQILVPRKRTCSKSKSPS